MPADPRFARFIDAACVAAGVNGPELARDRFILQIQERWLEVLVDAPSAQLTFVGIVAADNPIRSRLLGQFALYNLFHGGYSFVSMPETGVIHLVQRHPLAAVPPAELIPRLTVFEERAAAAGTWYLDYDRTVGATAAS